MTASARQLAYAKVKTLLATIRVAAGYATQPKVCDSYEEARDSDERLCLWVRVGDESPGEQQVSGRYEVVLTIAVFALIRQGTDDMTAEANALLQDVRNCICAYRDSFKGATGAAFRGLEVCETDEGVLSEVGRTYWSQPVVFTYQAGPTW